LNGENKSAVRKLILTASGGPFFGKSKDEFEKMTAADALKHPNWEMGQKITIDSATMMNKGFEVIEARHLFGDIDIEVTVHRQSIVHSAVEFADGAVIAQMGTADMRVPISYALSLPDRWETGATKLDFANLTDLTFEKPDPKTFVLLGLAFESLRRKNSYAIMLNALNEVLVAKFLKDEIGFLDIQNTIANQLEKHNDFELATVPDILSFDSECRKSIEQQK
jgi:1-deoxy-D-xylulose-5-phosphate reductoisomerase